MQSIFHDVVMFRFENVHKGMINKYFGSYFQFLKLILLTMRNYSF